MQHPPSPHTTSAAEEAIRLLKECKMDVNEQYTENGISKPKYAGYHYVEAGSPAQKLLLLGAVNWVAKRDGLSDVQKDSLYAIKPRLFAEIAVEGRNNGVCVWSIQDGGGLPIWNIYHPDVGQFTFHDFKKISGDQGDITLALKGNRYTKKEMQFSEVQRGENNLLALEDINVLKALAQQTSEHIFPSKKPCHNVTDFKTQHRLHNDRHAISKMA